MAYRNAKKYKRPGYKACGRMVYGDAKKALVIARGVKRLLNVEIKNHDVLQNGVTITSVPIIVQLSNLQIGDTTNTRDGSQVKMVGIDLNYLIQINLSGVLTNVRIMLVQDKQTNQAVYLNTDLLANVTAGVGIVTPRNLDNLHRFRVLYDRTHSLHDAQTTLVVRKYIKKDILLRYDATSDPAVIANMTQNSISLVQFTNVGSNHPLITSFMRMRFIDN